MTVLKIIGLQFLLVLCLITCGLWIAGFEKDTSGWGLWLNLAETGERSHVTNPPIIWERYSRN
jgi:hypothetical protein